MELLIPLFAGFHPDQVLGHLFSVDFSELVIVFGSIAVSLGALVWFGNWWSQ